MNQLLWYYAELERQRCLEVGTNEILGRVVERH